MVKFVWPIPPPQVQSYNDLKSFFTVEYDLLNPVTQQESFQNWKLEHQVKNLGTKSKPFKTLHQIISQDNAILDFNPKNPSKSCINMYQLSRIRDQRLKQQFEDVNNEKLLEEYLATNSNEEVEMEEVKRSQEVSIEKVEQKSGFDITVREDESINPRVPFN